MHRERLVEDARSRSARPGADPGALAQRSSVPAQRGLPTPAAASPRITLAVRAGGRGVAAGAVRAARPRGVGVRRAQHARRARSATSVSAARPSAPVGIVPPSQAAPFARRRGVGGLGRWARAARRSAGRGAGCSGAPSSARPSVVVGRRAGHARQRTSRRARKRSSARTNAGPKARQKTTLPIAWASVERQRLAISATNWPSVCCAGLSDVQDERSMISAEEQAAHAARGASGTRSGSRPGTRASPAPIRPISAPARTSATASTGPGRRRGWRPARPSRRPRSRARRRARSPRAARCRSSA